MDTSQERPINDEFERIRTIGRRIHLKRVAEKLTLGRAAEQSTVSPATLSRLERQALVSSKGSKDMIMPDTRTLTAVLNWLGDDYTENPKQIEQISSQLGVSIETEGAGTPQIVEAYLRADRNLDALTAHMLAEMFRLAYEQYSTLAKVKKIHSLEISEEQPSDDRPDE